MNRRYLLQVFAGLTISSISRTSYMAIEHSQALGDTQSLDEIRLKIITRIKGIIRKRNYANVSLERIREELSIGSKDSMYESLFSAINRNVLLNLASSNHTLSVFLLDKIEEDFKSSNVIYLDGWCLSKTEVDLCLLA